MMNRTSSSMWMVLAGLLALGQEGAVLAQDTDTDTGAALAQLQSRMDDIVKAAEQARADAEQARADAEQAKADAQQARTDADQARAEADKANRAVEDAEKSREEALQIPGLITLPKDAFFSPRVRGIPGGSLEATTHGLQWPYLKQTAIAVSGGLWVDTGYEQIRRGDANQADIDYFLQEGRAVLRITPTFNAQNSWFVQGQAELVLNKDQTLSQPLVADTDDLWIKLGQWGKEFHSWDVQVGRFEAFELYHFGMGMDLNTLERRGAFESVIPVPDVYGVNYTYYRPSGPGNVAVHYFPTDFLRIEGLCQFGNELGLNSIAGRGAAILDLGWLKIKGGSEYKLQKSQQDGVPEERKSRGSGGTIQFVFAPWVEFGFNGGFALVDHIDIRGTKDRPGSTTTWSVGGFANGRIVENLSLGIGANYTDQENLHMDEEGDVGEFNHLQFFGAVQYRLFGKLAIKAVVARAVADLDPSFSENRPYKNVMMSGRLRLQYDF